MLSETFLRTFWKKNIPSQKLKNSFETSKESNNTEINMKDSSVKNSIENNLESVPELKCPECSEIFNYRFLYCKPCNSAHFRDNFAHWSSGDSNIDELIQNSQLNANYKSQLIEWIEYSNLENIEPVAHGGFGSVYKAIWKDGPINRDSNKQVWDVNTSEWQRESKKEVAVKKLRNATQVSPEFLNEVNNLNKFSM